MRKHRKRKLDLEEVKKYIKDSSKTSNIYIGCDSMVLENKNKASYAIAVIVHIDGNKGCKVFGETSVEPFYGSMRMRLMQEVYYATEIALKLIDSIEDRSFEIHLDINPSTSHKSNVVVKEAIGYVRGVLGVDPILKPNAIASSTVADKYCR
jgi:uncharacterized protein